MKLQRESSVALYDIIPTRAYSEAQPLEVFDVTEMDLFAFIDFTSLECLRNNRPAC